MLDLSKDIENVTNVLNLIDSRKGMGLEFDSSDVRRYYDLTTDRDYRVLQWFFGPGMHTTLDAGPPIGFQGRGTRQSAMVLKHIDTSPRPGVLEVGLKHVDPDTPLRPVRVLEVGCGRGHCTLFLAGLTPHNVYFHGVDLLGRHIDYAEEANVYGPRVQFHSGDACEWEPPDGIKFDLVFGCESMCHLEPERFIKHVKKFMNEGAKLIIIDGFRSAHFPRCDEMYKSAMVLVEQGFRINEMPSKTTWKRACEGNGMRPLEDIDYTEEAVPFWSLSYRIASLLLYFPRLVRLYAKSCQRRKETVMNLAASCMVAHALEGGAAEYGMLVFKVY